MSYLVLFCSWFFSPFSIAITSLGEERANLSAFRTFVRFVLVWFCSFSPPLDVWEGLRFVIVALPGLFSYFFFNSDSVIRHIRFRDTTNLISCYSFTTWHTAQRHNQYYKFWVTLRTV